MRNVGRSVGPILTPRSERPITTIQNRDCLGPLRGTSPHSEAVLAFGAYGARGAIVTDLQ
jgi:hypothetical protein